MFFKIKKDFLPLYLDAYRKDWPKFHTAFSLIDHYIKRFEKYPEWEEKVNFYTTCPSEDISEDATFVFDNGHYICFDNLKDDSTKLKTILEDLEYNTEKNFPAFRDVFRELVEEITRKKSLEKIVSFRGRSLIRDFTEVYLKYSKDLIAMLPEEFYLDDLKKEGHAAYMFEKNVSIFLRSEEMIRTCIRFNRSTGIFRKSDDHLIGWVLYNEYGVNGNLFIDKEYRGQNLGTYVAVAQSLKIQKEGRTLSSLVEYGNDASSKLFTTLGSELVFDRDAIIVRKKPKCNKILQGKL